MAETTMSIFDLLPDEEAAQYRPKKSTDWKWTFADYIIHGQTFPEDYDFVNKTYRNVGYICGMSVPPVMIKRIVQRLIERGVLK